MEAKRFILRKKTPSVKCEKSEGVVHPTSSCENAAKNKGTGAGGANTNFFGKSFENKTCMKNNLMAMEFVEKRMNDGKCGFYLKKKIGDVKIIYVSQAGMKTYFQKKYKISLCRHPDEAYIVSTKGKIIVKILEKKEQRCEGSVETKLWAAPSLKREYEIILGKSFVVEYALCVNKFLSKKFQSENQKYQILQQILQESEIQVFHASEADYFDNLTRWIETSLNC